VPKALELLKRAAAAMTPMKGDGLMDRAGFRSHS
jgi:hypothetical protein